MTDVPAGPQPPLDAPLTAPPSRSALAGLSDEDLWAVVNDVHHLLEARTQRRLLTYLHTVLAADYYQNVAQIRFATDEWDNGYFYAAALPVLTDANGARIHPDFQFTEEEAQHLDTMFGDIAATDAPLTAASTLAVNLKDGTVGRDC